MNRLSSLITAGLTTGLSAAALGATAMAQGVFGGGDTAPSGTAAVQQVADATWAAVTAATQESATPQVVYVDKEPIVVTRQVQVPAASSPASQRGTEGATAGGEDRTPTATTTRSTPVPSPATVPARARPSAPEVPPSAPPPVNPGPALLGTAGVATSGAVDDKGGDTPRDDRVEPGDDRRTRDDDDRDDDRRDDDDWDDDDD